MGRNQTAHERTGYLCSSTSGGSRGRLGGWDDPAAGGWSHLNARRGGRGCPAERLRAAAPRGAATSRPGRLRVVGLNFLCGAQGPTHTYSHSHKVGTASFPGLASAVWRRLSRCILVATYRSPATASEGRRAWAMGDVVGIILDILSTPKPQSPMKPLAIRQACPHPTTSAAFSRKPKMKPKQTVPPQPLPML